MVLSAALAMLGLESCTGGSGTQARAGPKGCCEIRDAHISIFSSDDTTTITSRASIDERFCVQNVIVSVHTTTDTPLV